MLFISFACVGALLARTATLRGGLEPMRGRGKAEAKERDLEVLPGRTGPCKDRCKLI